MNRFLKNRLTAPIFQDEAKDKLYGWRYPAGGHGGGEHLPGGSIQAMNLASPPPPTSSSSSLDCDTCASSDVHSIHTYTHSDHCLGSVSRISHCCGRSLNDWRGAHCTVPVCADLALGSSSADICSALLAHARCASAVCPGMKYSIYVWSGDELFF